MRNLTCWLSLLLVLLTWAVPNCVQAEKTKRCWAHCVPWGFDQVRLYDQWSGQWEALNPLNDRSLLGRSISWDSGVSGGTRREIDSARLWGFDGFCVDVVRIDQVNGIIGRFFHAAEGTDFEIALCVDSHSGNAGEMLQGLTDFLRKYGNHPNMARQNGLPLIFAYSLGLKPTEWLEVRRRLADLGLKAFFAVRPDRSELALWDGANDLTDVLAGAEGIYDFGCNGFTQEQMLRRLQNARNALKQKRPDGQLIAGIAPGYLGSGNANSFYRPYLNSGSFRGNWEAAIQAGADQVCLTTWNDFNENTQIEPSALNRTALLRLNREFVRIWRGETPPKRPSEILVSYHEEVLSGDDWTFEIVSFSYDTEPQTARVRLLDESGTLVRLFEPVPLDPTRLSVATLRMTGEELLPQKTIRVQIAVLDSNSKSESVPESAWHELYPVTRRWSRLESLRTVRIPLAEISEIPIHLEVKTKTSEGQKQREAVVSLQTWAAAGRLELLRNGLPVAGTEIDHLKKPVCVVKIPLPDEFRIPEEVWVARFSDGSDSVAFSNPVTAILPGLEQMREEPYLETGADFDENWPVWSRPISRIGEPRVRFAPVRTSEIFSVRFDFSQPNEFLPISQTAWKVPIQIISGQTPVVWESASPNARPALRLNGDDFVRFPHRFAPYGAFTLTIEFQPDSVHDSEMPIFEDGFVSLKLDAQGRPQVICRKQTLTAPEPIPTDRPTQITVRHDFTSVSMQLNGGEVARAETKPQKTTINSSPRLGGTPNGTGFRGFLFRFELEASAKQQVTEN